MLATANATIISDPDATSAAGSWCLGSWDRCTGTVYECIGLKVAVPALSRCERDALDRVANWRQTLHPTRHEAGSGLADGSCIRLRPQHRNHIRG